MANRERMSPVDAAWLRMDRPTNVMAITGLMWFSEPVDWDRVREVIAERFVDRYPRFRQRVRGSLLGLTPPFWEDDPDFDLDVHLQHVALPPPGDRAALGRLVGDAMSTPLDVRRPLWQMWFVDGYGGGAALVARLHHALADGISLARVLLTLTDPTDGSDAAPSPAPPAEPLPERIVHLLEDVVGEARGVVGEPTRLVSLARQALGAPASLGKLLLAPPDAPTPLRGELGPAKLAAWSDPVPLADVKAIGRTMGATINDVLMAATTGAFHRVLTDRGSAVEQIRALVPFNLRPLDRPVPTTLGNRFGLVLLTLPVGLEDPRARLAELKRRMDAIKGSPEGLLAFGILGFIGLTPTIVERALVDFFGTKSTFVMTNVPGPRTPLVLAGTRVAGLMAWVPQASGIGIGVSVLSYDGAVTVGVAADERLVGSPEPLVGAFAEELEALAALGG